MSLKSIMASLGGLAAGLALAACSPPTVHRTPEALRHEVQKKTDPNHALPIAPILQDVAEQQIGRAQVVAVDVARSTITLRHIQQGARDWPSLSLTLRARQSVVARAQLGAEVDFTMTAIDGRGEILELWAPGARR